jgi:hypothetical protein
VAQKLAQQWSPEEIICLKPLNAVECSWLLCHMLIVICAMHARPFSPPLGEGEVMSGWYSDWQTAVAWLVVTAIATVIYFGPMTRLIDFGN